MFSLASRWELMAITSVLLDAANAVFAPCSPVRKI
jgi:hypothetical protein